MILRIFWLSACHFMFGSGEGLHHHFQSLSCPEVEWPPHQLFSSMFIWSLLGLFSARSWNVAQARVQMKIHMTSLQLKTACDKRCIMDKLDEAFERCRFCLCPKFTWGPPLLLLCSGSNTWDSGVFAQFDATLPATFLLTGAPFTTWKIVESRDDK